MKVPPISSFGAFGMFGALKPGKNQENRMQGIKSNFIQPLQQDTVSFTSRARYIKKYVTLPDEIKKILTPEDAVDMFRDMEWLEHGAIQRGEIGEGKNSKVYKNPWLKDYYLLILTNGEDDDTITIYSGAKLGNAIWQDSDNANIQILKRAA